MAIPSKPKHVLSKPAELYSVALPSGDANRFLTKLPELTAEYRPWRKFRYVSQELGHDSESAWQFVKLLQLSQTRRFDDLRQGDGVPFVLVNVPQMQAPLHRIDRGFGGGGPASLDADRGLLGDRAQRDRIRIRTLMDEAAESSIIEGAARTRKDARELLRSGRSPKTRGDRMIVNNYLAMQHLKRSLNRPLSIEFLLELQAMLVEGTLDDPGEAGRMRRPDERVHVVDERENTVTYTPPDATDLKSRLQKLCDFANRAHKDAEFLHPIVKACILHFMIGYEHPFCDGNGRTARAVFYWSALRSGYDTFEFMPISDRIRLGFARYPRAFLDTEEEGGDLTHFVLYNLDVIEQALDRLSEHLKHEEDRVRRAETLVKASHGLNLRQRILLEHALRHPDTVYTVKSHQNSNGISPNTAKADLDGLVQERYLVRREAYIEKQAGFFPAPDLRKRLDRKSR